MTVIGNLLLAIATLVYAGLLSIIYAKNIPRSGDYVVGYFWSILILNAAFILSIVLTFCIIAAKGGFSWLGHSAVARFFIVGGALLCMLITIALAAFFKNEPGPMPVFLRSLTAIIPIVLPLVLLVAGFILINQISIPPSTYKWPLMIACLMAVLAMIGFFGMFISEQAANNKAIREDNARFEDKNRKRILQDIDSCDVMKDMVFILVFTDANQSEEIRQKALAKIKSHPQWQQELATRLQSDWAPEAFNFLASNKVDSPGLFILPLKEGIIRQSKLIRERIRRCSHPSHFYQGQFVWEVERVLRTVEAFKSKDEHYLTEVKQLRAAFEEPSDFEKMVKPCTTLLDNWILKNN